MRRALTVASITVLTLLLSGCKFAVLNPQGQIAVQEAHIIVLSAALMLLIVIPVILLCLIISWRYRSSNINATYQPEWSHSTTLEVIWWTIPCIMIGVLAAITWISSHQLDPYRPLDGNNKKPIIIQAIALQWKWLFIYPEQNMATVNFIQIPVGVPVRFLITSEGPMNSLQIPQLAGQIYAMAGMQTKLNIIANSPGDYRGFSANFSGDGFSDMKFTVRASTEEAFNQWVKAAHHSRDTLTMGTYQQLMKPSTNNPVAYFSSADKKIFDVSIMKAMMPMKEM